MKTKTIRLPEELIKRTKEKAKAEGTTFSQKVRWLIEQWIDEETNDETPSQEPAGESQNSRH